MKARPIATDLDDADYPDSLKLRIQQIKVYSKKIGLKPTNNYTSLCMTKKQSLLMEFIRMTLFQIWKEPGISLFLESFGYKGFFDLRQAQIEREYLEKEGVRCEN